MSWDQKFLQLAFNIAEWSKDRSTKVGCVIVGPNNEIRSTGYNGMCRVLMIRWSAVTKDLLNICGLNTLKEMPFLMPLELVFLLITAHSIALPPCLDHHVLTAVGL